MERGGQWLEGIKEAFPATPRLSACGRSSTAATRYIQKMYVCMRVEGMEGISQNSPRWSVRVSSSTAGQICVY